MPLRVAASDWFVDPGRSGHYGSHGERVKRRWFTSWSDPNVTGKDRHEFIVLNGTSLHGLSLPTFGRECDAGLAGSGGCRRL